MLPASTSSDPGGAGFGARLSHVLGLRCGFMAFVDPFHSSGGPAHLDKRAHGHYHIETTCRFGQSIKLRGYDTPGTGGYRLCKRCSVLIAKHEPKAN